ncbi:MAG: sigma-54 factor interaction domain-containing protein, partial [Planctomycetales bacterium]|nr:sigma-54 factor interaction domain-containing protein [Planctomycetales bacterium]
MRNGRDMLQRRWPGCRVWRKTSRRTAILICCGKFRPPRPACFSALPVAAPPSSSATSAAPARRRRWPISPARTPARLLSASPPPRPWPARSRSAVCCSAKRRSTSSTPATTRALRLTWPRKSCWGKSWMRSSRGWSQVRPTSRLRNKPRRLLQSRRRQHFIEKRLMSLRPRHLDDTGPPIPAIIGSGPAMEEVYRITRRVARTNASVLLLGETGTGKELIATAIHRLSDRGGGPLVKVNCGALAENLLESELFGHVRGAFTGAVNNRAGRFQAAHGGTVFLDEINSTSLQLQVKLLRVLQQKEFERVGDTETIRVDTRVIAASNRDLMDEVDAQRF